MDDAPLKNLVVTVDDLVHQRNSFCLRDGSPFANQLGQVPALTQLSDDVSIVLSVVNVVKFDDVVAILESF